MEALTATLQEMVLVEHFAPALPLTIPDVADWAREFGDFGEPLQLPWLPPVQLGRPGEFSIGTAVELPRLVLRSLAQNRSVQLQSDRFAFGWNRSLRIGDFEKYPGYEQLKREQAQYSGQYREWYQKRFGLSPQTRLVELAYNNAAPFVMDDGKRRRLSEIFKWVQPSRPVNAFQVAWTELLELGRPDAPRVNAFVSIGAAPPVPEALIFNFAGFAGIDNSEKSTIYHWLDALHARILAMFDAAFETGR